MADRYTETTSQSWFSRIGGAIKGVLFGTILFLASFVLLFWNEGRAVKEYNTLKEGSGAVVAIASDKVDSAYAGKLVHLTGQATTENSVSDPTFELKVQALRLKRHVEMFQWKEHSESKSTTKLGGSEETTKEYTYKKEWSDDLIDSSEFKQAADHPNPDSMPYKTEDWAAENITLGAFTLSDSLVQEIDNWTPVTLAEDQPIPEAIAGQASLKGDTIYIGSDPATPRIGDMRVTFQLVKPCDVSVIAAQEGESFSPYVTKAGGTIEMLKTGILTAPAMFQSAQETAAIITWLIRLGGFFAMFIGLAMILKPLSVLGDVIPFLGKIISVGAGLIAFLISLVLSLLTIAIAWIVYRPLLGIALLVVAGGAFWLARKKLKATAVMAPAA